MIVEVCANSLSSAIHAQNMGAQRIELCQNLWCGGTTPSAATIEWTRQHLSIPVFVLIRPRSGDFCYTKQEFQVIQREIYWCKEMGVDGIVVGVLNPDRTININYMKQLVRIAYPMHVTFHRAFDYIADYTQGLSQLIDLGVQRVLTSGGKSIAIDGRQQIRTLVEKGQSLITIMAGGGITTANALPLIQQTGVSEIHLSGKHLISSSFQVCPMHLNSKNIPEFDYIETNPDIIQAVINQVHQHSKPLTK